MARLIGFQSQMLSDAIIDQYVHAQAACLKPINAFDRRLIQRYRSEVGGWIFPRVWVDDEPLREPAETARRVADRVCRTLDPIQDLADATHFLNESRQTWAADVIWLNAATVEYCRIMAARGWRVIVGSFGVGNPATPGDITLFADALRVGWAWEYHSYGAPTMDQPNPDDYALRYRRMWHTLEALHDPSVLKPLVLGEIGVDGGVLGSDHKEQGYRSFGEHPYMPQLQWAAQRFAEDPYVFCAAIFGLGMTQQWRSFDVWEQTEIFDWLRAQGPPARYFPVGGNVSEKERERYYADLFRRFGVPYNPASALIKHWRELASAGIWLGAPLEAEHPTENGRYIYQAYASAVLTYDKQTGAVTQGLPPLA